MKCMLASNSPPKNLANSNVGATTSSGAANSGDLPFPPRSCPRQSLLPGVSNSRVNLVGAEKVQLQEGLRQDAAHFPGAQNGYADLGNWAGTSVASTAISAMVLLPSLQMSVLVVVTRILASATGRILRDLARNRGFFGSKRAKTRRACLLISE